VKFLVEQILKKVARINWIN